MFLIQSLFMFLSHVPQTVEECPRVRYELPGVGHIVKCEPALDEMMCSGQEVCALLNILHEVKKTRKEERVKNVEGTNTNISRIL